VVFFVFLLDLGTVSTLWYFFGFSFYYQVQKYWGFFQNNFWSFLHKRRICRRS
jgi:hypothetical protein